MKRKQGLDCIFNPKSLAVAGVSSKEAAFLSHGQRYLRTLIDYGFKGKVYPVNPKGGETMGLKVYPNVKDITAPVDYVISCIPAASTPQLIIDCADKGVGAVHLFTSGFSESGSDEGKQLENELVSSARQRGVRLIGPNCGGVYCPKSGLSTRTDFAKESGPVALICQSGGNNTYIVREGISRGVRFSKVVAYGNAADINESELIEYLAGDPDTEIILAYIEGVKDGRLFLDVLKKATRAKPVIVLKGGVTESGAKAAASHTGALAGTEDLWDNLLRQAGAIRVYNLEELVDVAVAFSYLPIPLERNIAILGIGGGATVLATDDCTREGLMVPRFSDRMRTALRSLFKDEAGTMLNNPLDVSGGTNDIGFYRILRMLDEYDGIDFSIVHFPLGLSALSPNAQNNSMWDFLLEEVVKANKELTKALVVVIHTPIFVEDYSWMLKAQEKCYKAGIAVYHSIASAAKAVDRLLKYNAYKSMLTHS